MNVNSIYNKVDKIISLLNTGVFDILYISESKLDSLVPNSYMNHSKYRIIRQNKNRGAGGMLVYTHVKVTCYRRINLEPINVESICLDVKGNNNSWFLVCTWYRSPNRCKADDFILSCSNATELMLRKRNELIFIGDFSLNMLKGIDNPQGPNEGPNEN